MLIGQTGPRKRATPEELIAFVNEQRARYGWPPYDPSNPRRVSDPDAPPLDASALIDALERHQVSFVTVGGLAAQWQGAGRPTKDLDICPAWDRENLDRVASALRELGARLSGSDAPPEGLAMPLDGIMLSRMEITTWRTDRRHRHTAWHPPRRPLGPRPLRQLRENAILVEVGEHTVLVAALKDIIRSKEIADRPPDREALPELRENAEEIAESLRARDAGIAWCAFLWPLWCFSAFLTLWCFFAFLTFFPAQPVTAIFVTWWITARSAQRIRSAS